MINVKPRGKKYLTATFQLPTAVKYVENEWLWMRYVGNITDTPASLSRMFLHRRYKVWKDFAITSTFTETQENMRGMKLQLTNEKKINEDRFTELESENNII